MCKKVGELNGISQYEFCQDYINARKEQEYWAQKMEEAQYMARKWNKTIQNLQIKHCPL